MSLFTFLASDKQLPEIDLSGFIKLKIKDVKKMNPNLKGPIPIEEMDDESEVLFAPSEADMGGLNISICDNPPYDLDYYIKKRFVYWLEGNKYTKWKYQLTEYLKDNLSKNDEVQVWSILFEEKKQVVSKFKIELSNINDADLELLHSHNICITIVG